MVADVVAGITTALTVVNGGVFFAFSTFIVPAARRLPPVEAVHAFQAINRQVPRSLYVAVFLLSGLGGLATAIVGGVTGEWWYLGGGATAFAALLVSVAVNIPRNTALDAVQDAGAAAGWASYVGAWSVANHVRMVLCFLATAMLVIGVLGLSLFPG